MKTTAESPGKEKTCEPLDDNTITDDTERSRKPEFLPQPSLIVMETGGMHHTSLSLGHHDV